MEKPAIRDKQGRFPPGVSGNPNGRPVLAAEVKDLARKHSIEAVNRLVELMRSDSEQVAAAACKELLDRAVGKATQLVGEDSENRFSSKEEAIAKGEAALIALKGGAK